MWVDDLPEVNDYLLWKRRERARAILSDLSRSDVDWRAQLYVRTAVPSDTQFELCPPRLGVFIFIVNSCEFDFVMLVGPGGADHFSAASKLREQQLLSSAEWLACHARPVHRLHPHVADMPGQFFCLGVHLSQHGDASCEVEQFAPPWCKCTKPSCDRMADWRDKVKVVRGIVQESAHELARVMPTEWARQAQYKRHTCFPP